MSALWTMKISRNVFSSFWLWPLRGIVLWRQSALQLCYNKLLQMHHRHPGTINLECTNSFNNLYLHIFRRMLKEICQMHALVRTLCFASSWMIKITPVSWLQHALVSTCNCMLRFNMQSVFNNDCSGVKCLIVLPCTDVCLCYH